MNKVIFFICRQLLFLGFFHTGAVAQEPFVIRSFASAEMPASRINCLFQDRRGFIWIGAYDGLYRYDGYRYVPYRQEASDSCALSNSMIWNICEDARGNLWIATNDGVSRLDTHSGCFTDVPFPVDRGGSAAPDPSVRAVFADSREGVWAGTVDGSLYRLDLATLRWRVFPTGPPDKTTFVGGTVRAFHEDAEEGLWIGSGNGLSRYDPSADTFSVFQNNPQDPFSISYNSIWSIFEDREGLLWIGTNGGGLNRLDRKTGRFARFRPEPENPSSLSHNEIFGISQDAQGLIWIGTHGGGLNCLDPRTGRVAAYTRQSPFPYSVNHDQIYCMMKDRQGLIWIGSDGGLNRLDFQPKPFKKYLYQINYPFNPSYTGAVNRLLEDYAGILWLGTENGLIRHDRKTRQETRYLHDPLNSKSLSENRIRALVEGERGVLWVGTWGGGLNRLDVRTGQFTRYRHVPGDPASLADDQIRHLLKDSGGKIWISTLTTLHFYDEAIDGFSRVGLEGTNSCCFEQVNTFVEDRDGVFWMAAWGAGLYRWDRRSGQIKQYRYDPADPNGISSNYFLELFLAGDGSLWMYAMGRGLNHFDPKTGRFALYSRRDGLPNDQVQGILEDEKRRLWISTKGGLSRFDPGAGVFQNFDLTDGLPSNEFAYCSRFRSSHTGEFFFGSTNGVLAFHPDSIQPDTFRPPVVISSFSRVNWATKENRPIVDEWISDKESITLTHRDNVLTFEFAALSFRQPEANRYEYQLEGFSDHWTPLGTKRDVMFTNLSPGRYTLRVKASNDDGIWNDKGTALELIVLPPWYWSWWTKLIYTLIFAGGAFALYRFSLHRRLALAETKRMKELDAFKTRLYTNITHEFRTPLTIILGMARQIQDDPKKRYNEGLEMITRNGRRLLGLVNQMLDLGKLDEGKLKLHPQRGEIVGFLHYLVQSFESYAAGKHIQLHFLKETDQLEMDFDPDQLTKVVSNLLSNAVKYTPEGGQVYVTVRSHEEQNAGRLELRVKDTGPGIPPEDLPRIFDRFYQVDDSTTRKAGGTGVGLALTRELVHLMGGEIQVQSKVGEGSTFSFWLPAELKSAALTQPRRSKGEGEYLGNEAGTDLVPSLDQNEGLGIFVEELVAANNPAGIEVLRSGPISGAGLPPGAAGARNERPTILLIEDNRDVLTYLASCLESNYQLEFAVNGQEGIDQALEIVPDIIISDVMMPERDGYEVCEILKEDIRTSHIPIILLTAKADQDSRITGLKAGADAYLAKPFDREELEVQLEKLLELRRRLQARHAALQAAPAVEEKMMSREELFLKELREAVDTHLSDESFGIAQLCRKAGMSRSQLHNKLKALTGQSASHYLRAIRLERAKELLRTTDMNISEVAYEVGFRTPLYFTQVFTEEVGVAPSGYRTEQ